MTIISKNGGPLPLLMVVEYLESSMARDLLCKFPDNSAFDFDYTQSSIWSPLLPRPLAYGRGLELSRKLSYDENDDVGLLENTKKIATSIKRKFTDAVCLNIHKYNKMKKMKRRSSFGISPVSSSPTPKKAWGKVIRAASKHFKKKNKKKDIPRVHLDHSNYRELL